MVDRLGVHRADDAEVVGDFAGVRQEVAVFDAGLAVFLEVGERAGERERGLIAAHARQALPLTNRIGKRLKVAFTQQGLGVEGFELRRAARLEEVDDALGLGREVRAAGQGGRVGLAEDATHRERPQTEGGGAEEVSARVLHETVVAGQGMAHGISGR